MEITENLPVLRSEDFNREIHKLIKINKMTCMDAILQHAESNNLEHETIALLIDPKVKSLLRNDAEDLHYYKKTNKLFT